MCHGMRLLSCTGLACDRVDLQFGVILTMALTLLVVLTATHLENAHLVVTTLAQNRGRNARTCHQRRTDLNGFAFADHENLVDGDLGANFCRYLFYFDFFACDNAILLAAGFYDRVHVGLQRDIAKNSQVYAKNPLLSKCLMFLPGASGSDWCFALTRGAVARKFAPLMLIDGLPA